MAGAKFPFLNFRNHAFGKHGPRTFIRSLTTPFHDWLRQQSGLLQFTNAINELLRVCTFIETESGQCKWQTPQRESNTVDEVCMIPQTHSDQKRSKMPPKPKAASKGQVRESFTRTESGPVNGKHLRCESDAVDEVCIIPQTHTTESGRKPLQRQKRRRRVKPTSHSQRPKAVNANWQAPPT